MAFQIKNFPSIVAGMINRAKASTKKITDYNIGSVVRTMFEAPAAEIDEAYQQLWNGIKEAIPVAIYNTFNFPANPAIAASTLLTVNITSSPTDILVAAGTSVSFDGGATTYSTSNDLVIASGNTVGSVLMVADNAGALGNIPAGQDFILSPTPSGFVSATNASAIFNGTDAETDDQRKQRFNEYISTIARGIVAAIEYGAKTSYLTNAAGVITEQVRSASVVEPYETDNTQPIALVNVYVHNGVGSTSGDLVARCQTVLYGYTDATGKKIPGWKAAGAHVVVTAATEVPINVTAVLTAAPGYDKPTLVAAASAAINNYLLSLDIGDTMIFAKLSALVMAIPGVANFVLATPTADVTSTSQQKIMPGVTTIT